MSDHLRPWKRPPHTFRYVSDYLIKEAHLTGEQVCIIEIYLLSQESRSIRHEIDRLSETIASLATPDGIETERTRFIHERDTALRNLKNLETPEGIRHLQSSYSAMRERFEFQAVRLQTVLQDVQNGRRT